MNGEMIYPGEGVTPEQRRAIDQQSAWVAENLSNMVMAAARHQEEDDCTEDSCPGPDVTHWVIEECGEDTAKVLLLGAISDLANFFSSVRSGLLNEGTLREKLEQIKAQQELLAGLEEWRKNE